MLTPENLDLLKRLQPKIKKEMGEWQVVDNLYNEKTSRVELLASIYKKSKRRDAEQLDWAVLITLQGNVSEDIPLKHLSASWYLRIPKPIDWQSPERGLWGMIDWSRWGTAKVGIHGLVVIYDNNGQLYEGDLFTALLKALAEQEGV